MRLIRSFVEDRPIGDLLFSTGDGQPQQEKHGTEPPPPLTSFSFTLGQRHNASFENLSGDNQLHASEQWRFHSPLAHSLQERQQQQQHDIGRLLRALSGEANPLPHETLRQFEPLTQYLNALKTRINRGAGDLDEYDFTRYLALLDLQSSQSANGPCLFSYLVPPDHDGVHGQHQQQTLIYSDEFAFERAHILLSLLAFHQSRLEATSVVKEKTLLLRNCIDVLREMLRMVASSGGGGVTTKRRLYKHVLSSISSGKQPVNQNPSNVTLDQFFSVCLGGQAGIRARVFLCQARRCEIILADQRTQQQQSLDAQQEQALLGAISECYRQAYESATASPSQHSDGKLTHYSMFMYELSLATAQLNSVQRLYENGGDAETEEALQRAASIIRRYDAYIKVRGAFVLDETMRERYKTTLRAANALYEKLDKETGQQVVLDTARHYSVLTDEPYQFDENRQSTFERAMEWSRADLSLDPALRLDTLGAILTNGWQPTSTTTTIEPFRLPVEVRGAVERGDIDTAASIGVVLERRNWLRAILTERDDDDNDEGVFILNIKYRPQFLAELEQTEKALAYYMKSSSSASH